MDIKIKDVKDDEHKQWTEWLRSTALDDISILLDRLVRLKQYEPEVARAIAQSTISRLSGYILESEV